MKKNLQLIIFITAILLLSPAQAQEDVKVKLTCIAFYNIENLFDTINDPNINDEEFLPEGAYQWTGERYWEKLQNISYVIDKVGNKYNKMRPVILGLSEVENMTVLKDLVNTDILKPLNYGIVHYDSPDRRGVDVALLYQKDKFTVISSFPYKFTLPGEDDFFSRDALLVTGILDKDTLNILVNHWPSRRGGQNESAYRRNAAGDLNRQIVDSILNVNPNAKIIVMGDLNDDPDDPSVLKHLRAKGNRKKLQQGDLYNTMWDLYKNGVGTLAYRGKWNLFDQIIVSQGLLDNDMKSWELYAAHVFNDNFLITQEGRWVGYPYRTYSGGSYIGGYSDHFPSYIILVKKVK
jgi:hypothetical protein